MNRQTVTRLIDRYLATYADLRSSGQTAEQALETARAAALDPAPEDLFRDDRPYLRSRRRAALRAALALSALLLAGPALAADPTAPKAPREKPVAQVTIKVLPGKFAPGGKLAGKALYISSLDPDSCTAWIPEDDGKAWISALTACREGMATVQPSKGGAK